MSCVGTPAITAIDCPRGRRCDGMMPFAEVEALLRLLAEMER